MGVNNYNSSPLLVNRCWLHSSGAHNPVNEHDSPATSVAHTQELLLEGINLNNIQWIMEVWYQNVIISNSMWSGRAALCLLFVRSHWMGSETDIFSSRQNLAISLFDWDFHQARHSNVINHSVTILLTLFAKDNTLMRSASGALQGAGGIAAHTSKHVSMNAITIYISNSQALIQLAQVQVQDQNVLHSFLKPFLISTAQNT